MSNADHIFAEGAIFPVKYDVTCNETVGKREWLIKIYGGIHSNIVNQLWR